MLTSLALVFLLGFFGAGLFSLIKLPRIIGMLFTGILIGPFVLDLLDPTILNISGDLRKMALIIILIKAGLSLDISDLKKVGRPAVLMSFLPATFEILAFYLFAPSILGISRTEAAVMGAVLGAVSPAVVIPRMVSLMENKWGTKKGIPQMIMAGASCDDIFVIVLFTAFLSIAQGGNVSVMDFVNIPVSIILGILAGILAGFCLSFLFEKSFDSGRKIRNSTKVVLILGVSFLLIAIENWLSETVALSGLLAVVAMACTVKIRSAKEVSARLSQKFGKLWIAAEVILFVLVGAAVDIRFTLDAGLAAAAMIFVALAIRALGVFLCLLGTPLSAKERLFCVIAYLPKATVQAAIGSVPLAMGLPCGKLVLAVAVLGILITAPLGAIGIDASYKHFLTKDE
ncbi:MAG: cation:proton antiporter [Treponemataceae bacterium]|nr:cation:proton antiporter [Treponemataceae bacterium]